MSGFLQEAAQVQVLKDEVGERKAGCQASRWHNNNTLTVTGHAI